MPLVQVLSGGTSNEQIGDGFTTWPTRSAVTNGRRVFVVSCPRSSPVVAYVLAGIGVKGDTGGRTRSAARRASTERVRMSGAAFTLDADGGHRAYRPRGRTRATPAAPAPAASRARTDAGCNRRGCPSEARRGSCWRQPGAIEADPLSPKEKPAEAGLRVCIVGYLPVTLPPLAGPQFLPKFCMTCCR